MRLFYAIELDERTRQLLFDNQSKLKGKALKANFTRAENLHLTLRFMGDIEDAYFPVLKKMQDFVASKAEAFQLELSGPGVFERGHKSIVWWGTKKSEVLSRLQKNLEEEIRANGFPAETREYSSHITLAREFVSTDSIRNVMNLLQPIEHQFYITGISLMESTRVDGKLTYLCRYRTELRTAAADD